MRKLITIIAAASMLLTGCAGATYKHTYVAGSVASNFVNEAHGVYDDQVHAKLAACDPAVNPSSTVKTKSEFDACMTAAYSVKTQDAIVKALAIYVAFSTAFTAVMLGCEPNADGTKVNAATCVKRTYSDAELREWRGKIVAAAFDALASFPDADAKVRDLGRMLGATK